jgi:hypothetical protein
VETLDGLSGDESNRSQTAERLLAQALRLKRKDDLDAAVIAYYESLDPGEAEEDGHITGASVQAARQMSGTSAPTT